MTAEAFGAHVRRELDAIRAAGTWKEERLIGSPQGALIRVGGREVLDFCANNYLGLSSHPAVVRAAHEGLDRWGYGMSSVRFICGTQEVHRELERRIADFVGTPDAILYSSCFDANGGLFETLLGEEDAVVSDALNHASIIDGVRLSRAKRFRYATGDMADLGRQLEAATSSCRFTIVATDGVFSMDGSFADLAAIRALADRYGALVMVDDSHGIGVVGEHGRGTPEARGALGRIDILTGTLGKALGGASGGYTAASAEIVALLRQRSRPYLFSNALAPPIAAASLVALDLARDGAELRAALRRNSVRFREGMTALGFRILPGEHPIVPVMVGDARLATELADRLLAEGIYVIGFSFPVVPRGEARIRVQLSAAHTPEHVERALAAFAAAGRTLGAIA